MIKSSFLHIAIILVLISSCSPKSNLITEQYEPSQEVSSYVVLVRHAEKGLSGDDPDLTKLGSKRAKALAKLMRPIDNVSVHSTDFNRTKQTAQPTADAKSQPVQIYDARNPQQLFKTIRSEKGGKTFLVVGHSNSTPKLTRALDLKSDYSQLDESEYDKIFLVKFFEDGKVESKKLTFPPF